MTPRPAEKQVLQLFWEAVSSGDTSAGRAVVREQLDAGVAGSEVITRLLVPTQEAVGLEWQRGLWTVADEHAATAVTDAALAVLEGNLRQDRGDGPFIVIVCAEAEWHVLPARLAAQLACEHGARARCIGPSVPANHLGDYLTRLGPDALAVSATLPTALVGATRSIGAARSVGIPVFAGGAGFGTDDRRAKALGADGWFSDARAMASGSTHLRDRGGAVLPNWEDYHSVHGRVGAATRAYERLMRENSELRAMTGQQHTRTREDFQHILEHLSVSLLVEDPRLMEDFTTWLVDVLEARQVPRTTLASSYQALAGELDGPGNQVLLSLADALASTR